MAAKPELLAPAGDRESLDAALRFGADAVYLGAKEYSMRTAAGNFDPAALRDAVRDAHRQGVKVYLAANILPRNAETDAFPAFLAEAADCGIDALIAADLGVISVTRKLCPQLEVHASTQMGVVNYETARFLHSIGVKRAVLARELSLAEIAEIRRKTPPELELECFVHGAMCMSVSGRCLISEHMTGRDANRGACAQSCRWKYALMEEKRPGEYYPVDEDSDGSYLLSAKDLCLLPHLAELAEAGVCSFKIEGRAKSAFYTAGVTNAYRTAMDCIFGEPQRPVPEWVYGELEAVSHRPYTDGFLYGKKLGLISEGQKGYLRNTEFVGVVTGCEAGRLSVSQRGRFFEGDELEILMPQTAPPTVTVTDLRNADGEAIESANHAVMDCSFRCAISVPEGSLLRRRATPGGNDRPVGSADRH